MLKALIRLEDISPGGHYGTPESLLKLLVISDYLYSQKVPFHAAVIPRYVDTSRSIDHCISNPYDSYSLEFVRTIHALCARGASLGIHGYTHQYGRSVSGEGYEFAFDGCSEDCPPDDPPEALSNWILFQQSYAYRRFQMALTAFQAAGLRANWFEAPHYTASEVQRRILEGCSWLMYEDNPEVQGSARVTYRCSKSLIGKTYYVPTPLGYVSGANVEQDVNRIISQTNLLSEYDLASFFYHPFLEFPYIHLNRHTPPYYEEGSPLKRIIRHLLENRRHFVSILELFLTPRMDNNLI